MIKVENLTKEYVIPKKEYKKNIVTILNPPKEKIYGLKNISFEIKEGEFVGLVGLNGAGKTTLVKTLSGILTPTQGNVEVLGYHPALQRKAYTKHISVIMGQKSSLIYDLPVIESFQFYKDVYQVDQRQFKEKIDMLSEYLGIDRLLHIPVRKLSLGQRMKCEIGVSFLHEPEIIFLDEPTLGLDILSKRSILKLLSELNRKFGTTMILTTHDIEDISSMCERMILLEHGNILYDGRTSEFCERKRYKLLEIDYIRPLDVDGIEGYICEAKQEDEHHVVWKIEAEYLLEVIGHLMEQKESISDVNINTVSLTETIYELYEGK